MILFMGLFYIFKSYHQSFFREIVKIQREIVVDVSGNFRNDGSTFIGVVLLFLYGVIHSIGPGHGKIILSSAVLIEKINFKKIIVLAGIIAYCQGLSTFVLYRLFMFIGKQLLPVLNFKIENYGRVMTAILLIIMGVYLIYKEFKRKTHSCKSSSGKNTFLSSFLLGVIPCSGILNILLFLNLLKLSQYGVISILAICTGVFITLVFSGLLSNFFRNQVIKIEGSLIVFLRYIGIMIMILYGINVIVLV